MARSNSHCPSQQHSREKLLSIPPPSSLSNIPSKLIRSFSSKLRSRCHKPHQCIGEGDFATATTTTTTSSSSLLIEDAHYGFYDQTICDGYDHAFHISGCFGKILQRQISVRKGERRDNLSISLKRDEERDDVSISTEVNRREHVRIHDIPNLTDDMKVSGDVLSPTCKKCGRIMNEISCKWHNHDIFVKEETFKCDCGEFVNEISPSGCHNCGICVKEEKVKCNCGITNEITPSGRHKFSFSVKNEKETSLCNLESKATSGCQRCDLFVKEVESIYQKSGFSVDEEMYERRKCENFAKGLLSTCQESGCSVNEVSWRCQKCGVFVNNITSSTHCIRRKNVELSWSDEQRACLLKDIQEGVIGFDEDRGNIQELSKMEGRKHCGCFSNDVMNRLENAGQMRKSRCEEERPHRDFQMQRLPDDVIEMCLARASFSTLARSRMVCRKWRDLTMSSHLCATREKLQSKKPWLFLFGFSRSGVSSGEIHALDTSLNEWHSTREDMLDGRSLFSVVSLDNSVYIIGGCSSLPHADDKREKSTIKTHREVLAYSPFTSSWARRCSMGIARAMPIASVFEVRDGEIVNSSVMLESVQWEDIVERLEGHSKGSCHRSKWCNNKNNSDTLSSRTTHSNKSGGKTHVQEMSEMQHIKSYGLIVVGGQGIWKQPLFSAEIYDPILDTWREIAKLPMDHGVTCAGVVCNGVFYAYSETDKLAAYDFKLDAWSSIQISNSITRLHEYVPKLVSCKGKLILLAVAWGSRERQQCSNIFRRNDVEAATRMLWEYNPTLQSWILMLKHPDAPLDWNAVSVAEGNKIYGIEMFKIFGQVLDFVTVCDFTSKGGTWKRMSRMRLGNDLDVTSCFTKTAVVIQL